MRRFIFCLFLILPFTMADIITNGVVILGVNDDGGLISDNGNPSVTGETLVGVRFDDGVGNEFESTSQGFPGEGWGVADSGTGNFVTGHVGNGSQNIANVTFNADGTSATSIVDDVSGSFQITHDFNPSADTNNLYQIDVTIENTSGAALSDVLYRRVMDWDIDPTPFSEFVTINRGNAANLIFSSDGGFSDSNPLVAQDPINFSNVDIEDDGPADHGAAFDFSFGTLAAGDSINFSLFYGAGANEFEALTAIGDAGLEVFSLGKSDAGGVANDNSPVFIFGFSGVGGDAIVVPEPSTYALLGILALLGLCRQRKKRK